MREPITFEEIYRQFQEIHPRLSKEVKTYKPVGYLTIDLYLWDGSVMRYDYLQHRPVFISEVN